jgi:hypothetical protein
VSYVLAIRRSDTLTTATGEQRADAVAWPESGRTRMLNIGQRCAPVSVTSPGQKASSQVTDARDAVYGSACRAAESGRSRSRKTSNRNLSRRAELRRQEPASSSGTARPVRTAQAQVRGDAERAIASSQAASRKLAAAATRNSAANPAAFAVKEPPKRVTAPRPVNTIPAAMRTRAKTRRWRYSHGAIRRLIPDRGGVPQRHQVVVELGAVESLCACTGMPPVTCGARPSRPVTRVCESHYASRKKLAIYF